MNQDVDTDTNNILMLRPSATFIRKGLKDTEAAAKQWEDLIEEDRYATFIRATVHALEFAQRHGLIVYGGHALNAVMPENDKIYGKKEINDVDMLSYSPKNHARKLADELDDSGYGYDFVNMKENFMHDNSYYVSIRGEKIADFSYMPKESIDALFFKITDRALRPMAPVDFLLYSMHDEFSHPLMTPNRWTKTFGRFVKLLQHHPIEHDKGAFDACFREHTKNEALVLNACFKEIKALDKRPIVGPCAVAFMVDALKARRVRSNPARMPSCPDVPAFEVLSMNPDRDAAKVMNALKAACPFYEFASFRNGLWLDYAVETSANVKSKVNNVSVVVVAQTVKQQLPNSSSSVQQQSPVQTVKQANVQKQQQHVNNVVVHAPPPSPTNVVVVQPSKQANVQQQLPNSSVQQQQQHAEGGGGKNKKKKKHDESQ